MSHPKRIPTPRRLEPIQPPPTLENAFADQQETLRRTLAAIQDRTPVEGIRISGAAPGEYVPVAELREILAREDCDCSCCQAVQALLVRFR